VTRLILALLLALSACGGGGSPEPSDTAVALIAASPDEPESVPSLALVEPPAEPSPELPPVSYDAGDPICVAACAHPIQPTTCAIGGGPMGMETMCAAFSGGVPTFTSWSFGGGAS
jgi:hypothetical protein